MIDPVDQTYYYECFQPSPPRHSCGGFHDTATATQSLTISNNGWPANQRWTTDTPIVVDPNNDAVIYLGGTVLGRSLNRGGAFTMISPADDAHSLPGPVPADENDLGPFYANEYATISAIAPAKSADAVPVRADALRRDGHRPRVEDHRRGRDLDAADRRPGALGERDRRRPG